MSRWDGCETCVAWHNPVPFEEDMGENSEPIAFSKSHCHMNESEHCHLAGERHIIHVGQDNEHMNVCSDCYLKHHGLYIDCIVCFTGRASGVDHTCESHEEEVIE